jgi:hypothetical protein
MRFRKSLTVLVVVVLLTTSSFKCSESAYAEKELQKLPDNSLTRINDKKGSRQLLSMATKTFRESAPAAPLVEKYLVEGKLQAGEAALLDELKRHPHDDQLRFGLGTLQFLRAIEHLGQQLNQYGVRKSVSTDLNFVPIVRLPVPSNPRPVVLTYEHARGIILNFLDDLTKAQGTLAAITDANVKLPLHFGMIRLDLNGDGTVSEDESLWKVYAGINGHRNMSAQSAKEFYISFDRGDVHWLRGYCHLLMSFCEFYLAHDTRETFNCTAHVFFPKVDSPYAFLNRSKYGREDREFTEILDLVALVHTIRWPVVEPARMEAALHHLEAVVAQSKESWKWIMSETDDDREWLPNPRQTGVIPDVHVTEEMVAAWSNLMDQTGKVLAGERLVPFWRGDDGRGINVRKVFTEPRTLDLVLWVQGSAAAPYLETGKKTSVGTWRQLQMAFGDQFPGFAIWFN